MKHVQDISCKLDGSMSSKFISTFLKINWEFEKLCVMMLAF